MRIFFRHLRRNAAKQISIFSALVVFAVMSVSCAGDIYEDTITIRGITYKSVCGEELQFDISYPRKADSGGKGFPLLVYVHGGSWMEGARTHGYGFTHDEILFFNTRNIAVATVSYRVTDLEKHYIIKDCVTDVKDALRFITKNAEKLGVRKDKIAIYGHSAGGHLAMMAALADGGLFPGDESLKDINPKLVGVVSMSGPTSLVDPEADFSDRPREINYEYIARFLDGGHDHKKNYPKAAAVSPVKYLCKDSPPILAIIGENDRYVSPNSVLYLKRMGDEAGARVEAHIIKGAGHQFKNDDDVKVAKLRREFLIEKLK